MVRAYFSEEGESEIGFGCKVGGDAATRLYCELLLFFFNGVVCYLLGWCAWVALAVCSPRFM